MSEEAIQHKPSTLIGGITMTQSQVKYVSPVTTRRCVTSEEGGIL